MKESIVSRTINSTTAHVLVMNKNREVESIAVTVNSDKATDKQIKVLIPDDFKFIEVERFEVSSVLYGMTESEFMAFGKPYATRGKETRGMISKEIVSHECTILVMDNNRAVIEQVIDIPGKVTEKEIRKRVVPGLKYIDLVRIDEVKTLYAMPIDDFIKYGHVMKDRFSF